jgi:hypothetical protein
VNKHRILAIPTLAACFSIGVIAGYALPRPLLSPPDQRWNDRFSEKGDHERIIEFQDSLLKDGIRGDPTQLSKQLESQLRVEDLIIKSREAEFAKFTPFTALLASGFTALGVLLGALVTRLATTRGSGSPSDH